MKKTFLITGGAGFIGSNLIDRLFFYGEDINIICVDNFDPSYSEKFKQSNISLHRRMHNYKLYVADINDYSVLKKIFQTNEITHIVHLGGKVGSRVSLYNPDEYFRTNINGTVNLLQLAKEFCVEKFIFGSSGAVYGAIKDTPFREDMKLVRHLSPYAASKFTSEQICYTYSELSDIKILCLRFFNVYGQKQRPDSAIHKFSRLIAEEKPLQILGNGNTSRDYVYIDDVIQGILAAIDYDKSQFEIFNLGSAKPVKLSEVVALLEENFEKAARIEKKLQHAVDIPVSCADIAKARELLNYQPSINIKRGLKRFTTWFREFYNYTSSEERLFKN